MKLLLPLLALSTLFACNIAAVPLKGNYQDTVYAIATSASKQQTWNKLIDFLTAQGLAIKTLDQDNGLITTENTSFLDSYAWERKDGSLTNPEARVVCAKLRGALTMSLSLKPQLVRGQWVLRLKEAGAQTSVDVRLVNSMGRVVISEGDKNSAREAYDLIVKSTGQFEKTVAAALN